MKLLNLFGISVFFMALSACSGGGGTSTPPPSPPIVVNAAPLAQNITASVQQDSTGNSITLMATDADGDALTYAIAANPSSGTATISGNTASYTPNASFNGTDSFTYTADDGTASSTPATVTVTVVASSGFSGKVTSTGGTDVSGVQVEAFDAAGAAFASVTSDASGAFDIAGEAGTALTLKFTRSGYANQVAIVTLPDLAAGMLPLDVTMIARPAAQAVDAAAGGTVSDAQGTSVTIGPGSFVDAAGNAVTGNIDVTMTPVNTADPDVFASFPGEFSGIEDPSGTQTAIATLGTVEYTFSQGGAPLQLAAGQTAQIEMPLWTSMNPLTGNTVEAGDSIPLWSLNEDTAIWEQEGSGLVVFNLNSPTGYVLQASVSHFTWWNIDYPVPTAQVEVNLTGPPSGGVGRVFARTDAPGFSMSRRNVNGGGSTTGIIPANFQSCFWVEYVDLSGSEARTPDQCIPNPVSGAMYSLSFAVNVADTLTLNEPFFKSVYAVSEPVRIDLSPETLETSVTYAVTAGNLPAGLTLAQNGSVNGRISGAATTTGSYQFTVTGTDSGGVTDNVIITFDVVTEVAPLLQPSQVVLAPPGAAVNVPITISNESVAAAATSWSVVNSDGSPVRAGVTITSGGVFTMDSFPGGSETFMIRAYSAAGPSNIIAFFVTDDPGQQPGG